MSQPQEQTPQPQGEMPEPQGFVTRAQDYVKIQSQPLRPYLLPIGRILLVTPFISDGSRLLTEWGDQLWYLERHRHFPPGFSHVFLVAIVVSFFGGSALVIFDRCIVHAVAGLIGVLLVEGLGYGLLFNIAFLLRNVSVTGGLFIALGDAVLPPTSTPLGDREALLPPAATPTRRKNVIRAGRVLLALLFLGAFLNGGHSLTLARGMVAALGLLACVVGVRVRFAALLVLALSAFNIANGWWRWTIPGRHREAYFESVPVFFTRVWDANEYLAEV
ncbi:SURF4 family-domain-containing protein [Mycena filopes]|nr:SURF4 family-domain-containing protein [Mycena filopes]